MVSFGETMLRLSPPTGTRLEEARSLSSYVAGTESNALACMSRLGLRCAWLSALPSNPLGRRVAGELRGHGVDTSRVVWADGNARLGTFYAEEGAAPLGTQVHYDRAGSACALVDPDSIDLSVLDEASILHLTGVTPALGGGARQVFTRLLSRAQENGVPVSFDVNYRAKLWEPAGAAAGVEEACGAASLLFCTREDAVELWGYTGSAESVLRRLSERFGAHGGVQTLVLTLGSEGSAELRQGEYRASPAFPSEGAVRFGSGDAFAAGYVYAYLEGPLYRTACAELDITALQLGNAVAALKRCIPGDMAIITPDELLRLLRGTVARFR